MGKFLAILLIACALAAGALMYYQQVYAYYDEVAPNGKTDVEITPLDGSPSVPIAYTDFRAIDASSSPIRYRACFSTPLDLATLSAAYQPAPRAVPLTAPGWFKCFDAREIGKAMEESDARAFLGRNNVTYGIDRIVAIHVDGRGWVWDQINRCGELVFDGQPAPADCPPPPEGY